MNNGALLVLAPIVAGWVGRGDTVGTAILLGVCTLAALGVNLADRRSQPKALPCEAN